MLHVVLVSSTPIAQSNPERNMKQLLCVVSCCVISSVRSLGCVTLRGSDMATTIIDDCINCGACEDECPNGAISMGEEIFVIDPMLCTECVGHHGEQMCAAACPPEACVQDPGASRNRRDAVRASAEDPFQIDPLPSPPTPRTSVRNKRADSKGTHRCPSMT